MTPSRLNKVPSSKSNIKGQIHGEVETNEYGASEANQTISVISHKPSKSSEFKKGSYSSNKAVHTHSSSVVAKHYQQTKLSNDYTNPVLKAADSSRSSKRNITPLKYNGNRSNRDAYSDYK